MIKSTGRSLVILAGAWLLSTPGSSQGGGFFCHPHHRSFVTTTTSGSALNVVPASTLTTSIVPASTFMQVVPAASMTMVPVTSMMMVPASSLANASPLSALASNTVTPGFHSAAMAASLNQAAAASPIEAQAAQAGFPSLAQAAQSRGVNGGKFVLFLKNVARTLVAGLGGSSGVQSIVRTLLTDLVTSQLGPLSGGLATEVEKILGEVFGADPTGGGDGGAGAGGGQCFTIRVCVDGNRVTGNVVNPGVANPGIGGGVTPVVGGGRIPSLAPLMMAPSGQVQAALQSQGPGANDQAPPAPSAPTVVPSEAPASMPPPTPSPAPPAAGMGENSEKQHREVMSALNGINESLKKLSERR